MAVISTSRVRERQAIDAGGPESDEDGDDPP